MQSLLQQIAVSAFITPELKARIQQDFHLVKYKKGDLVLEEKSRANYLYFIQNGTLHNYYHYNGKQITSWFYLENQFVTSWHSFYGQKSSFESIECLEDCTLYQISYRDYQKIITDFPAFGNFARTLAEHILVTIDHISKNWSFLTAKEKYQIFQEYFPKLELKVKLGLISSFLGISQETLSRIRAKK